MKSDLERIMLENQLDGILVVGSGMHNPAMVYLTGGGHFSNADLIIKRGQPGILFHGSMERDEAAKSGLELRSYSTYPFGDYMKQTNQNRAQATVLRYRQMFTDAGLTSGRVGLYGKMDAGHALTMFSGLQAAMPGIVLVGDVENKILQQAMATKDEQEVARIRRMGKVTVEVVGKTADYLTSQQVKDGMLVKPDGKPVTIGDVKQKINLWLAESGVENPVGTIFAIGRDAGIPHSSGNPEDIIFLGQPIVYDIYPCEAGGGYYYDFTRTWCLGYAPEEVATLYDQVLQVFNQVTGDLEAGMPFTGAQERTCELFEAMGHPTLRSNPVTESGYVHSVGHGIGLNLHERPFSGSTATPEEILAPGCLITIEPGLYYPERGMGVRLENSMWVRPDGVFETLAEYPLDLVLPMKG